MSIPLQVRVLLEGALHYHTEAPGAVEIGRQREGEGLPPFCVREKDHWRLVIAPRDQTYVSRDQARLEPRPDG
jgi:hypothetical protein